MTIAYREYEGIGARTFLPEGPYGTAGQTPLPNFAFGTEMSGDAESEYIFLQFAPTVSVTLNQGDFLWWDNSGTATQTTTGAGSAAFGASVGTFFLGGRCGDPAVNSGSAWSYTFAPGTYGIWVQRAGTSVGNIATGGTQTKPANSTAVLGQLAQPASALAGSMGITPVYAAPATGTFTANTTNGSATLTAVSTCKFLVKGQTLSGTGIPNGAYITDIQGSTVSMSAAATATNTGTTVTAANQSTYTSAAAASGATQLQVANIPGIYPNQTVTGTNVSSVITSITGSPGAYILNLATATTGAVASGAALTMTGYPEVLLRWPQVALQN